MKKYRNIDSYFKGVIENIEIILDNNFYKVVDKENLNFVKSKIEIWYKNYQEKNTLKCIEPKELENLELEITDFFDKYVATESIQDNYAERLLYDFDHLEHDWKNEMLGGKHNG